MRQGYGAVKYTARGHWQLLLGSALISGNVGKRMRKAHGHHNTASHDFFQRDGDRRLPLGLYCWERVCDPISQFVMGDEKSAQRTLGTPLRKQLLRQCRRTCCQLQHWSGRDTKSRSREINRMCGNHKNGKVATHPQSPWNVRDGDGPENLTRAWKPCGGSK